MTAVDEKTTSWAPSRLRRFLPGLGVVGAGVGASYLANQALPALSALTAAVVLGVVVGNTRFLHPAARPGVQWATRRMLRIGVVLLGLQLSLEHILELGAGTIVAVVLTAGIGFLGTLGLGRLLGLPRGLSVLVATGFSICGASAIAAMECVVRRKDSDVATAIALVTVYGGLAIALIPMCGPLLGLTGVDLGAWAGLSVHEVAQVVAAASPAGAAAVATAAVIKLSRVVLLAPMVAGVSVVERRARRAEPGGRRPPLVPMFVVGFLVAVVVRSLGFVPESALALAKTITTLLLAGGLFGLGCMVDVRSLFRTGARALLLGLLSTVLVATVAAVSLRVLT